MTCGYVYILTNPSMPGLVKIGRTAGNPEERAKSLYQTGVPTPFVVANTVYSPDCIKLEASIHAILENCRVSGAREFFETSAHEANKALLVQHWNQVNSWLQDFLPDHDAVHCDEQIDIGFIGEKLSDFDLYSPEVVEVVSELTPQELEPAARRQISIRENRIRESRARKVSETHNGTEVQQ